MTCVIVKIRAKRCEPGAIREPGAIHGLGIAIRVSGIRPCAGQPLRVTLRVYWIFCVFVFAWCPLLAARSVADLAAGCWAGTRAPRDNLLCRKRFVFPSLVGVVYTFPFPWELKKI